MRIDRDENEAVQFGAACSLDGTPVRLTTYRRNGVLMPHFTERLRQGFDEIPDEGEEAKLSAEVYEGLNKVQARTLQRIGLGWTLHEIAKDEGVSHAAIYFRIRGRDGYGGMVAKSDFVWFWWESRLRGLLP